MISNERVQELVNDISTKTKPLWELVGDWTPIVSKDTIKERFLTCSVCLEQYQEPKLLPCGHIFCKECIESTCVRSSGRRNMTCPICRQELRLDSDMVHELPDSYLAKEMTHFVNAAETNDAGNTWRLEHDFNDMDSLPRKLWFGDVCLRIPEDIIALLKVSILLLGLVAMVTLILTWLVMLCWILAVKLVQVCLFVIMWPVNLLLSIILTVFSWTLVLITAPFSWLFTFASWFCGQCLIPLVWCWEHFVRCILLWCGVARLSVTAVNLVLPVVVLVLLVCTFTNILPQENRRTEPFRDGVEDIDLSDIE